MLLSEPQRMIRDTMRDFARARLTPFAAEWDRQHEGSSDIQRLVNGRALAA